MKCPSKLTTRLTVTPDMCGRDPYLAPTAVFTMFQNVAGEHAEAIGNGAAALHERDLYWLTVHTRIDFHDKARLMEEVSASTWVNPAKPIAVRGFRSYDLRAGDRLIAEGITEWAAINTKTGKLAHFSEFGYPDDFEFSDYVACGGKINRFRDEFADDDLSYEFTVRASSIDIGHHMNNVVYVRALLDCFSSKEIAHMPIKTMQSRYIAACMEGETLGMYKKRTESGWLLGARRSDGKIAVYLSIELGE